MKIFIILFSLFVFSVEAKEVKPEDVFCWNNNDLPPVVIGEIGGKPVCVYTDTTCALKSDIVKELNKEKKVVDDIELLTEADLVKKVLNLKIGEKSTTACYGTGTNCPSPYKCHLDSEVNPVQGTLDENDMQKQIREAIGQEVIKNKPPTVNPKIINE